MVRLAVIGCGRIGRMHAANISTHPDTTLAGILDIDTAAAKACAESMGVANFKDFDELAQNEGIDGVLIASATETHSEYIERSVDAGLAVLCEKPIDLNLDRVNQCRKAIMGSDLPILIGFNRRFDPGHKAVRDAAHAGEIGDIHQVIITSRDPGMPPRQYIENGGGLLRDMTIHDFDLARFMLGDEPVEVFAVADGLIDSALAEELNDHDTAMIVMKTADGKQCHINNSRTAVYGYDQRVEILGSEGMLISSNRTPHGMRRYSVDQTECATPYLNFFIERYAEAFLAEIGHFARCIKEGTRPSVGFDDGRAALILAEAAYRSMREKRLVRVDEFT